jgi:hypothetical protein
MLAGPVTITRDTISALFRVCADFTVGTQNTAGGADNSCMVRGNDMRDPFPIANSHQSILCAVDMDEVRIEPFNYF